MSGKYKPMYYETTDEDITSGEDGPLSQQTAVPKAAIPDTIHSRFNLGRFNFRYKHRNKVITSVFIISTLTFAISTWVTILLFGFVFAPKLNGEFGEENEQLVCGLPLDSEEIIKPLIDRREYLFKELYNKLRVLVISDPKTELSGAALSVLSGTLNEGSIDGLAHLCEHMLFLGNDKYSIPDYFFSYLGNHGGTVNAYTDLGITNYFFQVNSNSFNESVDIFSNFFINPLFSSEYVQKEINAINSEYVLDKLKKSWRISRLLQVLSKADSPFRKFDIGNTETLNIPGINLSVSDYYNRFYSSNLMTVVLYGSENVSEQMSIAESNFGSIQNKNMDRPSYAYPYDGLPKLVIAEGITKETDLILVFQLPSFQEYYKLAPKFLVHLLSYSGNGGYIGHLKENGLVFDVDISVNDLVSSSLLQISMNIPSKLIYNNKWSDIIEKFFSFIFQLQNLSSKELEIIFDSWIEANKILFNFERQKVVVNYVSTLSRQIQSVNASEFFLIPPCALEFDFNFLHTQLLGQLTPSNLLTILYSDSFNLSNNQGFPDLTQNDTFFDLHYETVPTSSDLISQWNRVEVGNFDIPNNLPIPSEFNLLSGINELNPMLTLSEGRETWHLQNTKFLLPYLQLACSLETTDFANSTRNAATVQLYNYALNSLLSEHLDYYQGFYTFSYSHDFMTGMLLNYEGYSDTSQFNQFMASITELATDIQSLYQNGIFNLGYLQLENYLENFYQNHRAYTLAFYYFQLIFYPNSYRVEDIQSTLGGIRDNFTDLMTSLHQNSFLVCFSFGNIDNTLTTKTVENIQLKFGSRLNVRPDRPKLTKLCPGKNYTYWQVNPIKGDVNSALDVVYELGTVCGVQRLADSCDPSLLRNWVLLGIVSSILSPKFFSQLRTEEQLGYIVFSFVHQDYDNAFLHFTVQSSVKDPDYLEGRVDAFLLQFRDELVKMTPSDLNERIMAYNESIIEPQSFNDVFTSVWSEIRSRQYQFSRNAEMKDLLTQISGEDIISYFNNTFFGANSAPRINFKVFVANSGIVPPNNQSDFIQYNTIEKFKAEANLGC